MKSFSYSAKDVSGKVVKSVMVAEDEHEFLEKLHERGLFVTSYNASDAENTNTTYKFKTKELAFDCRQLSAMLSAGLTLVKAIDILCKEQEKEVPRKIWRDIYENVQKGESFSASLELHAGAFPSFLVSMVAAGESSGSLDIIMKRMSDHYAKENKLNNKIKGAMMYPIILLCLSIVIVIGMFTFIMPTFIDLFENPDDMPGLTKVMMGISTFFRTKWFIVLAVIVGAVFGFKYALKMPSFKLKVDRNIIKGKPYGKLVVKVYTARFARTFSSLYSSGIPMVECIQRASAILGNTYIDEKFETVIDEVKQGEPLSAAIQRTEIFEPMFCSIIYVGEESGSLDDILESTSDYYEEESDSAIQRLVGMIEPLMIIILGVVVGMIIASVLPALYGSMDNIQ